MEKKFIRNNQPQKVVIIAGLETFTCNSIAEAIRVATALLQEGQISIEIQNVSAKIEAAELDQRGV